MRVRPISGLIAAGIGLAIVVATATACGSSGHDDKGTGKVAVVAGENFWGDVAAAVGGSYVSVKSIIDQPNKDPHEYEATTSDAAAVAKADLVIENGFGYDEFLSKLVGTSGKDKAVLSVQKTLGGASDDNPHIWYDTAKLPTVAAAIASRLGELDKSHKDQFEANAKAFDASLAPIESVIAQIRAEHAGSLIAFTERVPQYLTDAAGLKLGMPAGFARAVEQGDDPSPADTAEFEKSIENRSVKVLLLNTQVVDTETNELAALARSHGVPVVDVTETVPPGKDFVGWQLEQAKALLAALGA